VAVLSLPPLIFYLVALFYESSTTLGELAGQGEFFGGHVTAITSSLTLIIVIAASYMQQAYDRTFRLREQFLAGLSVIGQYDIAKPGCEQAMRLLDHYSELALELGDSELLLLLNSVMTSEIRARLEKLDELKKSDIYVSARAAKKRIAEILRDHHMRRKGLKK
jgi:chromosomal replication initiation ATPase DnaA